MNLRRLQRERAVELIEAGDIEQLQRDAINTHTTLMEQSIDQKSGEVIATIPACAGAGCYFCCYLFVTVLPNEAFAMCQYLEETLTDDDLAEIKALVAGEYLLTRELVPEERRRVMRPCPLLYDGKCRVYPVRELSAAGYNSFDVDDCEQLIQGGDKPIYREPYHWYVYQELMRGTNDALKQAGLEYGQHELIEALHIILNKGATVEAFLAGEKQLQNARITFDTPDGKAVKVRQLTPMLE